MKQIAMNYKNKNICVKCKYYIQHYTIQEKYGIHCLRSGHCTKTCKYVYESHECKDFIKGKNEFKRGTDMCDTFLLNDILLHLK